MPERIETQKLLLVEGKDEVILFEEIIKHTDLNAITVFEVGGKDKFKDHLCALPSVTGFRSNVRSIGIVRDADNDSVGAFQSVRSALKAAHLPEPAAPLERSAGEPYVTVLIVPNANTPGMIENVCLDSVADDPAIQCIDRYFECLNEQLRVLAENDIPKARVRTFLASREWLEISHFEYLQKCMEEYHPGLPISPSSIVPKIHVFLASRYTPDLNLGTAAKKSDREDSVTVQLKMEL